MYLLLSITCFACKSKKQIAQAKESNSSIELKKIEETTTEPTASAINFIKVSELSEVLAEAEKQNKWIYLDVGAKWCVPCQIMKKEVYTNKETVKVINDNFIPYQVEIDKGEGPDLKLIFEIKAVPTLLFIDSRGRMKLKKESALSHTGLINYAKEALALKGEN
jgi:thiol:disulfide interchange protein